MKLQLSNAPCSWGIEFADNPDNPPWQTVLNEISQAGYKATELGPLGYLPTDSQVLAAKLEENGLGLIAGTIFKHLHKAEFERSMCVPPVRVGSHTFHQRT